MNAEKIEVKTKNKTVVIKNRWELLDKVEFLFLVSLIALYAAKKISKSDYYSMSAKVWVWMLSM
jgi:hypothetical protein